MMMENVVKMTYKYEQFMMRVRWVDYCRLRHIFPVAYKDEPAHIYFRRLVLYLKEKKI